MVAVSDSVCAVFTPASLAECKLPLPPSLGAYKENGIHRFQLPLLCILHTPVF